MNMDKASLDAQEIAKTARQENHDTLVAERDAVLDAAINPEELENFIPISRYALVKELKHYEKVARGDLNIVDIFPQIEVWRHMQYRGLLHKLKEYYLPFNPDRDTICMRKLSPQQLEDYQRAFVDTLSSVLVQANFRCISHEELAELLSTHSLRGLELVVDMGEYEESLVFLRGREVHERHYRHWKSLWLKKYPYKEVVFSRLFIMLKLKPEEERVRELMQERNISEKKARKLVLRTRQSLPKNDDGSSIYLKVFKQLPQSDLEMMFPNTEVKFKLFDKIKLGVTAGGGVISGAAGMFSKLALIATNPVGFVVALFGFGAVLFRQVMSFFNTRNKYMLELSERLYFHALADNSAALTLMADRGEDEDIKEELLFYFFLSYYPVHKDNLVELDQRIEEFLRVHFKDIRVDFEIEDPLGRLLKDGLVFEDDKGWLFALPPAQASAILQDRWKNLISVDVLET